MENNSKYLFIEKLQNEIIELVKGIRNIRFLGITKGFLTGLNKK